VLRSILGSPGHVVEEDRIALLFGEATFVSQVLRIGHGENIAFHEKRIQLAQAPFGLLDGKALNEAQALNEAPREVPTRLLHGHVCIAVYARRARVLRSILGSPGHVVEEDRIALLFGEATFVSQILRIGHVENFACDEKLIQLAQAPFGLLDWQALNEAPPKRNSV
jgi:hypothetical protein